MSQPMKILVTGATGKQGGAVARSLIQRGHKVRALTRKPEGPAARALAALGAEISAGNLDDRASLDRDLQGMDAIFAMSTPFEAGTAAETHQGVTAADAAKAAGAYLVYTSVANADKQTGIPHFDSKYVVEQHIRAIGAEAAIIAPAYFMENLYFGVKQLREGVYASPLAPDTKLAQVAVSDIASVAVSLLEDRARFAGTRHDLGGDELSGKESMDVLARVTGRTFNYFQVPLDVIRGAMGEDGVKMYQWFQSTGYTVDRAALRREFPDARWLTFAAWAGEQDWKAALSA